MVRKSEISDARVTMIVDENVDLRYDISNILGFQSYDMYPFQIAMHNVAMLEVV